MTDDLLDRLARQAVDQAREAVSTAGYFTPSIDVAIDRKTTPIAVTLHVVPGEPTRITNDVDHGDRARSRRRWRMALQLSRNCAASGGCRRARYSVKRRGINAKLRAVVTLASSPYAAAKIIASEARIDPDTRAAELSVEIASGPPFRVGRIEVSGLKRYDAAFGAGTTARVRPGDPYSGAELDQFLRRLNGSGYFASAQAAIDADPAVADDATLKVAVIEAPTRKVEGGIGYSTDTEFRVNGGYRNVDIDGHATQFNVDARIETLLQKRVVALRPSAERRRLDRRADSQVRAHELERVADEDRRGRCAATVRSTSATNGNTAPSSWTISKSPLAPTKAKRTHCTSTSSASGAASTISSPRRWDGFSTCKREPACRARPRARFGRAIARFAVWYPLGIDYQFSARAEGGAAFGASRQEVPSTLLFRTGGDTTVRGYAFDSLGVTDGQATVPGRYFIAASVEATRWINATWGIATFVDAGNAFDDPHDVRLALGYGVGARVRTPIGPFRDSTSRTGSNRGKCASISRWAWRSER